MRLLIDLQGAQNNSRPRGIGRYSLALTQAIARNAKEHQVFILLNGLFADTIAPVKAAFRGLLADEHFLVMTAPGPVSELDSRNDWRRLSAEALREHVIDLLSPDAVLITSLVDGGVDDTLTTIGRIHSEAPTAAILYDLIRLTDPDHYLSWDAAKRWYMGKMDSLQRADLLLAISESAGREAVDLLGVDPFRVKNISSAADERFSSNGLDKARVSAVGSRLGIKRRYLMHTSAYEPRKNFQGLVKAFGSLPKAIRADYQLMLVCKLSETERDELRTLGKTVGLRPDDLVLPGFVPDEDLVALYTGCHLFVFPSLHEGFGLPALEAMCCGAPAIGSNATSIPEVIGREDALFDPTSTMSMSSLIEKALTDGVFYQSLRENAAEQAKKFSWDDSAKRTLKELEQLATRMSASRKPASLSSRAKRDKYLEVIAELAKHHSPSDNDLLQLAFHTEANERAVETMKASALYGGQLTWRIEGPFDSTYSLALLNRETSRALAQLGHQVVLHSTEGPGDFPASPQFLKDNPDLAEMHERVPAFPHGKVNAASRNLYPPRVKDMSSPMNLLHHYAWEESGFPQAWVTDFNAHLSAITCLSAHVEKVMIDSGVSVPMITSGCGIDHWERVSANTSFKVTAKAFRILHVSSCFPRKGVDVLLQAYGDAFSISDDVTLIVKTFPNPHNDIHVQLAKLRTSREDFPDVLVLEGDMSESDLKALYQQCHVLVSPSRAEGFGLPMAEAMLSGLPVITTNWGGQLDFCTEDTAWLVDYTFKRAETHFGLFASVWAEPRVDSLAHALRQIRDTPLQTRRAKANAGRRLLLESFRWQDVVARMVNATREWIDAEKTAPRIRLGWMTTWNTKCGIAAYSGHFLEQYPGPYEVFAPYQDGLVDSEGSNCTRAWRLGKEENDLSSLETHIERLDVNALVVQFNYGFYNFRELKDFLCRQVDAGRIVVLVMHATVDPTHLEPHWNWRLAELQPALARCHRILVHSVHDLNRLKDLGLINNVSLFPLGVIEAPKVPPSVGRADLPLVASYGYCLPHKGFVELLQAVALLRDRGTPVRLRLVNAEYPITESAALVAHLKLIGDELNISDLVEAHHSFLDDEESLALLDPADLVVFPYQATNESASAAVRFGLASRKPVGVTPLRIFDDLGDAVHRFQGTSPESIADGIAETLSHLKGGDDKAKAVESAAERWREEHSFKKLGLRLHNMFVALARAESVNLKVLDGSSVQLKTQVGELQGRSLHSTGKAGFLMFGPYINMAAGSHSVRILGKHRVPPGSQAVLDAAYNGGGCVVAHQIVQGEGDGLIIDAVFHLPKECTDFEIRLSVDSCTEMRIDRIELTPL